MANIVGVRFKSGGKMYWFDPGKLTLAEGQWCIVETARGRECGEVVQGNREISDSDVTAPLKPVIRVADAADVKKMHTLREKEKRALAICSEKAERLGLEMTVVEVEYTFDESKILFYFTADGRVDFRELVKELAGTFKTRIELRQIGVRDECKMKGGLGMCGRPFCCHSFMNDFNPVSIKMAKEQGLSLNPVKISGTCGRLMCCLGYEQQVYEELGRGLPRVGALVRTPDGTGHVTEVSTLKQTVRVNVLQKDGSEAIGLYAAEDVKILQSGKGGQKREEAPEPAQN